MAPWTRATGQSCRLQNLPTADDPEDRSELWRRSGERAKSFRDRRVAGHRRGTERAVQYARSQAVVGARSSRRSHASSCAAICGVIDGQQEPNLTGMPWRHPCCTPDCFRQSRNHLVCGGLSLSAAAMTRPAVPVLRAFRRSHARSTASSIRPSPADFPYNSGLSLFAATLIGRANEPALLGQRHVQVGTGRR